MGESPGGLAQVRPVTFVTADNYSDFAGAIVVVIAVLAGARLLNRFWLRTWF